MGDLRMEGLDQIRIGEYRRRNASGRGLRGRTAATGERGAASVRSAHWSERSHAATRTRVPNDRFRVAPRELRLRRVARVYWRTNRTVLGASVG